MAKFCQNCGKELNEGAEFCLNCGKFVKKETSATVITKTDGNGFGWGVLGFFIPLVGLILFLVWKKDYPKKAKGAGIGALIGFVLNLITVIGSFFLFSNHINLSETISKKGKCAEAYCYSCSGGKATCVYYDDNYESEYITCDCND